MMKRSHVGTGTEWEKAVGYSRATRIGNSIHVSGTTATDESGKIIGVGDPYAQTVQVIRNIQSALERLGGRLEDVVRTRTSVTNIDQWQEIGRAHGEFFREIMPATSMVEVRRLITPEVIVEIEADAVVREES